MRYSSFWSHRRAMRPHVGLLALCITLVVVLGSAVPVAANQDLSTLALQHVAQQHGLPLDQLFIGEAASASFPLTRVQLQEFKVVARDGRSFAVSCDATSRHVVDATALAARTRCARRCLRQA